MALLEPHHQIFRVIIGTLVGEVLPLGRDAPADWVKIIYRIRSSFHISWKRTVRAYLNENLPERWIRRGGDEKSFLRKMPPRSPDLSSCVLPLPASIDELKQRIPSTLDNVTGDMLQHVCQELNYWLDVCYVTGDAHIEHLWNRSQNKLMIFNT